MKRILLIRTFKLLGAGGPIPPLGLLYISSAIKKAFGTQYEVKILDTGTGGSNPDDIKRCLRQFNPNIIGLSALSCEADLMQEIVSTSRSVIAGCKIIIGGPHATVSGDSLLADKNIDYVVMGEGENTIVELLKALDNPGALGSIKGIAYRENDKIRLNSPREYISEPDEIPFPDWGLIDLKQYSGYPNWNGLQRQYLYAPVLTSRGCPYKCIYCHNIFGKKVRMRSPENVLQEMMLLFKEYGIKEFHFVDDIFNYDSERSKRLCSMIIASRVKVSLAFPNGLRADNIDDELITLLKKAGTYKINFGFETATPRLQAMIKKDLDINMAHNTVKRVSGAGIMTGGYFMFGFPTQTREEILQTIDFAVNSVLDNAYFFKVTPYPGSELYDSIFGSRRPDSPDTLNDLHFFSVNRSYAQTPPEELNDLILQAQQKFYLHPRRLLRILFKSSHKWLFLRTAFNAACVLLQSFLLRKLAKNLSLL
ncbi:MAG: radical SAM protein [Candidatus Omnitrophica bacterium]|nr:radical SAM protein [Candidatus Omnitrophota bacterium]